MAFGASPLPQPTGPLCLPAAPPPGGGIHVPGLLRYGPRGCLWLPPAGPDAVPVPPDLPPPHPCLSQPPSLARPLPSLSSLTISLPFPSIFLFCWPPASQQNRNRGHWCAGCAPPGSTPSCPLPQLCRRESWFYLFCCLFGKRAAAILGPGCCSLPGAAGGRPCWPPRNVAGTPRAIFTSLQLLAQQGRARPARWPRGSPVPTLPRPADPTWPLGPPIPPFPVTSPDLRGLTPPASRNPRVPCQDRQQVPRFTRDSTWQPPPPHPGAWPRLVIWWPERCKAAFRAWPLLLPQSPPVCCDHGQEWWG